MSYADLKRVREKYVTLRELVINHPGGRDDAAARVKIERLCNAAILALDDPECRARLRAIVVHASEAYSRNGHRKWDRSGMSGADYLRLQMLIGLEAVNTRPFFIENARDRVYVAAAGALPSIP